jgi:hypothetical protein
MVRRCNLVEMEGDGVAILCMFHCLGDALGGFIYAAS